MALDQLALRGLTLLPAFVAAASAQVARASGGEHEAYSWRGDLPFWSILTFGLFIYAVKKLGWTSLTTSMSTREQRENTLIAEAETKQREAMELLKEHQGRLEAVDETVREMIEEARRDAQYTRDTILAAARAEAEALRQRAQREIQRARDQALDEIFDTLTDRVAAATEERLATRLTADDQNRLVDAALAGLTTQPA